MRLIDADEFIKDAYPLESVPLKRIENTPTVDLGIDLDRLKEFAEADKEGRLKIYPKGLKCPSCEKYTVYSSVDHQFYLCYSCGFRYSKEEAERALEAKEE